MSTYSELERQYEAYVDGPLHDARYGPEKEHDPCPECGSEVKESKSVRRWNRFVTGFVCTNEECNWDFAPEDLA